MIKHEELVSRPEYWLETIQNEVFRQVTEYLSINNMTQSQLAIQLGVSKGYVSQIMKGEFNYTLKKLIELSLAIGKAPVIQFMPLKKFNLINDGEVSSTEILPLNKVADPDHPYKSKDK